MVDDIVVDESALVDTTPGTRLGGPAPDDSELDDTAPGETVPAEPEPPRTRPPCRGRPAQPFVPAPGLGRTGALSTDPRIPVWIRRADARPGRRRRS